MFVCRGLTISISWVVNFCPRGFTYFPALQKKTEHRRTKPDSYPSQGEETERWSGYDAKTGGPSGEQQNPEDSSGLER